MISQQQKTRPLHLKLLATIVVCIIVSGSAAFQVQQQLRVRPILSSTRSTKKQNSQHLLRTDGQVISPLSSERGKYFFIDISYENKEEKEEKDDGGSGSHSTTYHHQSEILEGTSPKVIRLRKKLQEIWCSPPNTTSPILLIGPRGSGKSSLVVDLLDRLPSSQTENVHQVFMDEAIHYIDTVLGTEQHPGVLDELSDQTNTTIVLMGFQSRHTESAVELERRQEMYDTFAKLIMNRTYTSTFEGCKEKTFRPRIIATYTETPDFLRHSYEDDDILVVQVPALESRKADMEAIASSKIKYFEEMYGLQDVKLSRDATHRLLDHRWELGESELDQELCAALEILSLEKNTQQKFPSRSVSTTLESKHMLVNSYNEKMRHRLLYEFPILRNTIIQSPWVFDHTLRYIVIPAFVLILGILFLGPQSREHNAALTVFWAGWWPAVMLAYPFVGRIWCSICPFMAVGNLAQETVTGLGVTLKKWPKWSKKVGALFAFSLFFAILMWEELWNLPQSGALSASLLLLITSGAVFNSVQYEDRMWCRYLCPIGAMCRIFGTMSMLEVRSWSANCEGCTNPQCVKGNSPAVDPTDNFALKGCTMKLKNNQLRDMGDCTMCMSCIKNCEREVPELNSRPIGLDYGLPWLLPIAMQKPENLSISQVETNYWLGALVTVLQGSVLVHYMPKILLDFGLNPSIATATPALDIPFVAHTAITAGLLALPGLLSLTADKVAIPLESAVPSLQRQLGMGIDMAEQRVIINLYDRIMKSDVPLEETLKEFDPDGDGLITCWECQQALGHLNLPESQCDTLMDLMKRRFGNVESLSIESWLDYFQELYMKAQQAETGPSAPPEKKSLFSTNELRTKKTFVEIFNDLDKDGDGFISEEDFRVMLDKGYLKAALTEEEQHNLFASADHLGTGRLNLFEFMSMMRKTVRVGIQEIGYGYLPLAWASLTAYWLSVGMKEFGLVLARLPDTFFIDHSMNLPSIAASTEVVHLVQTLLVVGALPFSIGLTQKLCNDNKIRGVRFGLHAAIQMAGAAVTLYLMLSSNPLIE